MTRDESKARLLAALQDYLPQVWYKRENPFHPEAGATYPGAVTEVVTVAIDGVEKVFFIRMTEFTPPAEEGESNEHGQD